MSNLARITPESGIALNTLDDLLRFSEIMAKSGYFKDAHSAAQAVVKISAGKELGIGAIASMTGIHIIKDRPSIGANLMAAMIKRSDKYDYRVIEHSAEICKIHGFEIYDGKREQIGVSEFTLADAKKAGTLNIEKFPKNMLFARAISNLIRFAMPDLFLGGGTFYTPEELGAEVDDNGDYIEAKIVEPQAHEPQPDDDAAEKKSWMDLSSNEIKRLNWTIEQGRKHLEENFRVRTRQTLSLDQLKQFVGQLKELPTQGTHAPKKVTPVVFPLESYADIFNIEPDDLKELITKSHEDGVSPENLENDVIAGMVQIFVANNDIDVDNSMDKYFSDIRKLTDQGMTKLQATNKWVGEMLTLSGSPV